MRHCKCRSPVGPVQVGFVVTRFESGMMPTTSPHPSWSLVAPVLWSQYYPPAGLYLWSLQICLPAGDSRGSALASRGDVLRARSEKNV
jgi:hypothetical protein